MLSSEMNNLQTIMASIDANYEWIEWKERPMHVIYIKSNKAISTFHVYEYGRMHYCIFQHIHVMNVSISISLKVFLFQI